MQLKVEDPLQLEKLNGVVLVIVRVQLLILEIEGKAMALHNKNMNGNICYCKILYINYITYKNQMSETEVCRGSIYIYKAESEASVCLCVCGRTPPKLLHGSI